MPFTSLKTSLRKNDLSRHRKNGDMTQVDISSLASCRSRERSESYDADCGIRFALE